MICSRDGVIGLRSNSARHPGNVSLEHEGRVRRQLLLAVEWLGFVGRSGRSLRFSTVQKTVQAGEHGFRVFVFQYCETPSLVALGYTSAFPGKTSFRPQQRPDQRLFPSWGGVSPYHVARNRSWGASRSSWESLCDTQVWRSGGRMLFGVLGRVRSSGENEGNQ